MANQNWYISITVVENKISLFLFGMSVLSRIQMDLADLREDLHLLIMNLDRNQAFISEKFPQLDIFLKEGAVQVFSLQQPLAMGISQKLMFVAEMGKQ